MKNAYPRLSTSVHPRSRFCLHHLPSSFLVHIFFSLSPPYFVFTFFPFLVRFLLTFSSVISSRLPRHSCFFSCLPQLRVNSGVAHAAYCKENRHAWARFGFPFRSALAWRFRTIWRSFPLPRLAAASTQATATHQYIATATANPHFYVWISWGESQLSDPAVNLPC